MSVVASPGAKDIGLLDVVLDPNFATNHRIFFSFFDYVDGTDSNTYVARARLDEAKLAVTDVKVIFRAQPAMPSKRLGAKTGGRIAIAPDGNLFMTIGDRSDSPPWDVAQQLDNHLGKIIHITPDGAPAPDNPFIGKPGVLPEIWAYGVRSPEGLAFDPRTGPSVAERARPARRRRAEHHREGQELRLAGDRARHRLSGHRRSAKASRTRTAWRSRCITGIR